jgi:aspartate/methionine/tyrosine aminotransferase
VWFVSDEIYHQIEYGDERASTALEVGPGKLHMEYQYTSFTVLRARTGFAC